MVLHIDRCQLNSLAVGGLRLLLVGKLYTYLIDVIGYVGLVIPREVEDERVSDGLDIIDSNPDTIL